MNSSFAATESVQKTGPVQLLDTWFSNVQIWNRCLKMGQKRPVWGHQSSRNLDPNLDRLCIVKKPAKLNFVRIMDKSSVRAKTFLIIPNMYVLFTW